MITAMLSRFAVMVIAEKAAHGVAFMGSKSEEKQYRCTVEAIEFHHLFFLALILEPA